ncbi:MAG TPA: molybdopterin cofactor-binding domain-containing protein, partial [Candidatus Acidoferrales bacterium]|nr:molybdopterin cofactor-binding domain-containing protein [Candidatus Acidoferrales bacterium]
MSSSTITRRDFLKTSATGGAALVIGFYLPWEALAQQQQAPAPPPSPFEAWIRIGEDNSVTLILGKSEMGQGVKTSLPQILAEELEVEWKSVRVEQAATRPEIYRNPGLGTGGSSSVRTSYTPLRQAAAAAREMLISAGAKRWEVER